MRIKPLWMVLGHLDITDNISVISTDDRISECRCQRQEENDDHG